MNKPERPSHLAATRQEPTHYLTADERAEKGRALRDTVPGGESSSKPVWSR